MAFKAYLYNGGSEPVELEPRNGLVYKEEYNETRDSATIVVRSKEHIDVEPFDYVIIEGDVRGNAIVPKAMDVDSVSEDQTSFGDDPSYDTTISLFSETKELERVTLPNLSITMRKGETPRSVAFYIERYLNQYAPLYKVTTMSSFSYEKAWILPQSVIDRFSSVDCPEFSWNKPTLYEVLTDLMQVDDCIPVIHDHTIGFIDLKERKGEADDSGFFRVVRGQSSQDYNQNLTVNMQNAISNRPVNMVDYISMRNEGEAILTSDNMQLITQKPIYEINKVTAIVLYSYETGSVGNRHYEHYFMELDITQSVKEKMAYDVLSPIPVEIGGSNPYEARENFAQLAQTHQIANVWFTRGGRFIEGFGKDFQFYNRTEIAIQYILRGTIGITDVFTDAFNYGDYRDIMFKVEYTSLGEINVNIGKNSPLRNPHMAVFDNQGSSYVDIGQQSLFEYAKANRLANKIIEINGTYTDESDVPELAETYDGSVIFSRELQFQDDIILFHAYATENYVLSNFFTSVRAKRRSWAIASGKEALTRHENAKLYIEFSRHRKTDSTLTTMWSGHFDSEGPETLLSPLYKRYNDDSVKLAAIYTVGEVDATTYPNVASSSTARFVLDCQASATGMSLSFSVQFADNYSAGEKITIDGNGRYINNILPYADANGEFSRIDVRLLSYSDPADGEFVWGGYRLSGSNIVQSYETHSGVSNFDFRDIRYEKARLKPVSTALGNSDSAFYLSGPMKKDQREVVAITIQAEYCSDSPNIIVKDRFVAMHHLVSGSQESYSGLRKLASKAIMGPSTLPSASDLTSTKYTNVGFLYRETLTSPIQYATISTAESAMVWQFDSVADGEKFAVMEGYHESSDNVASRVVIIMVSGASIFKYEPFYYVFGCLRRLSDSDDSVPYSDSIVFDQSSSNASITDAGQSSCRIYWDRAELYQSWGFCDANRKILLIFNNRTGDTTTQKRTVYVNLMQSRDATVRKSIAERHIVDSMTEQ